MRIGYCLCLTTLSPALASDNWQTTVNPLTVAEQDLAAESRVDVAAALGLYRDDALVQYGGLCAQPCVCKAVIRSELVRRVAAKTCGK